MFTFKTLLRLFICTFLKNQNIYLICFFIQVKSRIEEYCVSVKIINNIIISC